MTELFAMFSGAVRLFDHQPHAGAVEEGQVAEAIEAPQPKNIPIERLGTVDVADCKRDLPDMVEIEKRSGGTRFPRPIGGTVAGLLGSETWMIRYLSFSVVLGLREIACSAFGYS